MLELSIFYCELSASKDLDMTRKKLPLRRATKCLWDWQVQLATKMPMGKNGYQKKNKKNSLEELKPWLLFLCFLRKGYELAAKCSQHQQKLQCCRKDLRCVKLLQMQNKVVSDLWYQIWSLRELCALKFHMKPYPAAHRLAIRTQGSA